MKTRFALKAIGVLWLLSACVTINVYFPAAAAEKAADKIIEGVWGPGEAPPNKPAEKKTSSLLRDAGDGLLYVAASALNLLVPTAQAQAADLNISTPAIKQLTASMEARHAQLKQYYDSGAVGLTSTGLVEVRDLNAVPLPERTQVRKLVGDENTDRNNLYREIAIANGHPEWEADIRNTFAKRWIDRAQPGWHYQESGEWKRK